MTVISTYNIKGGVGKTAAAVNLAYLAAEAGNKVLVWDLDPQGAAGFYLRCDNRLKGGFKKMLNDQVMLNENIHATPYQNLWLVPADLGNRHLDVLLEEVKQSKKRLKLLISSLEKKYDYIFLDCPPGIGLLSEAVFTASDIVLIPAIPTTLSMRTYDMIVDFFTSHELKTGKLLCFFSMVDVRKNLHNEIINKYKNRVGFLNNYIPYLSTVEKMGVSIAPVPEFAPNSYATLCFRGIWNEINQKDRA